MARVFVLGMLVVRLLVARFIRDTYGPVAYINNTFAGAACARSACVKSAFVESNFVKSICAGSTDAVKYSEILLQFFESRK